MKKYKCSSCANACTPICKQCTEIKTPSGRLRKPSLFVMLGKFDPPGGRADILYREFSLTRRIAKQLSRKAPIPVAWVMEYNKLVEPSESE